MLIGGPAGIDLEALKLVIQDEVDHACHRVGTVHGRSTAGQNIDALDQTSRNLADINRKGRTRLHALPVDQDQGAVVAQIAQASGGVAGGTVVVERVKNESK